MTQQIDLLDLALSFIPVVLVIWLMAKSNMAIKKTTSSIARMLLQLMLVGYALLWVFQQASPFFVSLIVVVMMLAASWLALNVVRQRHWQLYSCAVLSIFLGGGLVLLFVTQGVLRIDPWYDPRYLIPLGGMIFSSSMTAISLALERYVSELKHGDKAMGKDDKDKTSAAIDESLRRKKAKHTALNAAMIPVINSMLAVGVVSLPGMMTGQILSGVEPYIAARYQILVMTMVFSATGFTVFSFMYLLQKADTSQLTSAE